MSKINAFRVINLNYNRNTMRINDEIIELGGESTLLSLRNGGGKTVMVQMLMAPFLSGRYRDLKDRKFSSYFGQTTPTYIMTEWLLDNDSGYVLIGIAVRKRPAGYEDEIKDELEVVAFTHEYKTGNAYDIHSIPFVENHKGGLRLRAFGDVKRMMEELKSSRRFDFDYYDLNADYQRKRYYERLLEYNINHKEWQNIIRKMNLKESGLSDLFYEAKTIPSLLREWFLPAIEEKLNEREDRLKNFREIINKYILQLKENEHKIFLKEGIEEFTGFADKIREGTMELKGLQERIKSEENILANFYKYIQHGIQETKDAMETLKNQIATIQFQLKDIEHERLSYEYYQLQDKINESQEKRMAIENELSNLSEELSKEERKLNIFECAKLHEDYIQCSRKMMEYEIALDNAKKTDDEKSRDMKNAGYTLNIIYTDLVSQSKKIIEGKEQEIETKEAERLDLKRTAEEKNAEINSISKEIGKTEERIKAFDEIEGKYRNRYKDFNLKRNLLGEFDEILFDSYGDNLSKREASLKKEQEELLYTISDLEEKVVGEQIRLQAFKEKGIQTDNDLVHEKEALEGMGNICQEIEKIMVYGDIPRDRMFDKEYIMTELESRRNILEKEKLELAKKAEELKLEMQTYEFGENVNLPQELCRKMEEWDIPISFGLKWLKLQRITLDEKLAMIKRNPFLPYSLIMSSSKIRDMKDADINIFTQFPIPIVEQDRLEDGLKVQVVNDIYNISNLNFYMKFNDDLLNEAKLRGLLEGFDRDLAKVKEDIKAKEEEISKFSDFIVRVKDFKIKAGELEKQGDKIAELENTKLYLKEQISNLEYDIQDFTEKIGRVKDYKETLRNGITKVTGEIESFRDLENSYSRLLKDKKEHSALLKQKENLDRERCALIKAEKELEEAIGLLKDELTDAKSIYNENQHKNNKYSMHKDGIIIEKDLEDIEALYNSLEKEMGKDAQHYSNLYKEEKNRHDEITADLEEKEKEYGLKEADYINIKYDKTSERTIKAEIKKLKAEIENNKTERNKTNVEIGKVEVNRDNKLEKIKELGNIEGPKEKALIFNIDFDSRKKQANREKAAIEESLREKDKELRILENNKMTLEEYKDMPIIEEILLDIPIKAFDGKRKEYLDSYKELLREEVNSKTKIDEGYNTLSISFGHKDEEFFTNTIESLYGMRHQPDNVLRTLDTVREIHDRTIRQLRSDLDKVEQEGNLITKALLDYVKEVYDNMKTIDDNSSLNIGGKSYKLLNIEQPEWNEEANLLGMKDYVGRVTDLGKKLLSDGKGIEEILGREITNIKLYESIVGINSVDIKLYKIEVSKPVRISWNEVAENSGGEGFVSAFVIMVCLLSYMRREEDSITSSKEEGKVLIMDNPFAQTNAEHLLKPLMDMAKKYNTQLICFSGLGGDSIYNRFDNIYVLTPIDSKLHSGMQIIESEHKKGEALTQLSSSRFQIEYEQYEQIKLF